MTVANLRYVKCRRSAYDNPPPKDRVWGMIGKTNDGLTIMWDARSGEVALVNDREIPTEDDIILIPNTWMRSDDSN